MASAQEWLQQMVVEYLLHVEEKEDLNFQFQTNTANNLRL